MSIFTGSCVALVTPFDDHNQIDFAALNQLIDFHLQNGTDAILVCGTTGEPCTMTNEEEQQVIAHTVKRVAKRVPVIAGTGSNDTHHAILYATIAEQLHVDALLVVTPYYNKTTQKGLISHYTAIADRVHTPIIMYNVPSRTGLNMLPQTVATLSQHKNICALKEASGNLEQAMEIIGLTKNQSFDVYSGEDSLNVPIMLMGGLGCISVVANVMPKYLHVMSQLAISGDAKQAASMQIELLAMCKAMFIETNPIPVKTALQYMGYTNGNLRLPLVPMEQDNLIKLKETLKKYQLIK